MNNKKREDKKETKSETQEETRKGRKKDKEMVMERQKTRTKNMNGRKKQIIQKRNLYQRESEWKRIEGRREKKHQY